MRWNQNEDIWLIKLCVQKWFLCFSVLVRALISLSVCRMHLPLYPVSWSYIINECIHILIWDLFLCHVEHELKQVVRFCSSGFPKTQSNPFLLGDSPMISTERYFFLIFPNRQVHLQHCYSCHRELKPNKTIWEIRIVQLAFIEAKWLVEMKSQLFCWISRSQGQGFVENVIGCSSLRESSNCWSIWTPLTPPASSSSQLHGSI